MSVQIDIGGALFFAFLSVMVVMGFRAKSSMKSRVGLNSAKYPHLFSSTLTRAEVLTAVEERLKTMTSIRARWKIQDRVDRIGRLQAMLTVAYNLAGDDIKISFLLNLLAAAKPAGGTTVEWSYVMMAPISKIPPELDLWETNIYKQTTLEIRSALFSAQGDSELAEFVQEQARAMAPKPEPAHERERHIAGSPESDIEKPLTVEAAASKTEQVQVAAPQPEPVENPEEVIQKEEEVIQKEEDPILQANTLNFLPPNPQFVGSGMNTEQAKCIKCSQSRDPSFNFCLYCGHVDG